MYEITDNFMASCGIESLTKIISIMAPAKVEETKFCDIYEKVLAYLKPQKKLVIAERTKFFGQSQTQNEKVTEFLARLRESAKFCEFDELKKYQSLIEEMIRMGLIAGLRNPKYKMKILEKLQTNHDMTVTEIVESVQQLEQVLLFTRQDQTNATENIHHLKINDHGVDGGAHFTKTGASNSLRNPKPTSFKAVTCNNCGGKNHIARNCTQEEQEVY